PCVLLIFFCFLLTRRPLRSTLFPYTTLFRISVRLDVGFRDPGERGRHEAVHDGHEVLTYALRDLHPVDRVHERLAHTDVAEQRRSEEHTSELQSRENLVCRLLLEKKKTEYNNK